MKKVIKFSTILILLISILLPVNTTSANTFNFITASRTVTPASIFTDEEAEVTLNVTGTPPVNVVKPNDLVLVLDKSGSMQTDNRFNAMINAAKSFVDLIDLTKHSVGIVDFSTSTNSFPLSTDGTAVKNYIDNITMGGNTNTAAALNQATSILSNHRPDAQPVIVLLTDGQANDTQAAKLAAQAAKEAGIVFYTIALLGPNEDPKISDPNLLLEEMATTSHHHHFVLGSVGLQEVYEAIVEEIGLASAYDVKVTETVDPNFEIVPGSYENNIPQPTVTGNKLVWEMEEFKNTTIQLKYKIRLKDGVNAGSYSVASNLITYKDYTGTTRNYSLPSTGLQLKNRAPIIDSITESKGNITGGESITIKGDYFRPGVKVFFNNAEVTNATFVDKKTITLIAPAGNQGEAIVKVQNDDLQSAQSKYDYTANPEIISISPTSGPYEGGNTITINGKYFLNGITAKFGEKTAQVSYLTSEKISVVVPPADKVGSVNVTLENPDGTKVVANDAYSYNEPSIVDLDVSPLDITLSPGESQQLTVTGILSDNTTKDVTLGQHGTLYKSNATTIVTVNIDGLVQIPTTAKDGMTSSLTVENKGIIKTVNVKVKDTRVKLVDISVDPVKVDLAPGETNQMKVTAHYSDNTTKDISLGSEGTTYSSASSLVATVSADGLISVPSSAKYGYTTSINVMFEGISKLVPVEVIDKSPKVSSLEVTPDKVSLEPGQSVQLNVTGTLSDGSSKDVTAASEGTTYSSNSVSVSVSNGGNISVSPAATVGTTVIVTVTNNGVSKDVAVTIKNPKPVITNIDVTPATISLKPGETQQLAVNGTFSDGTTKDVTMGSEGTTYVSSAPTNANVDTNGLITVPANAKVSTKVLITVSNGSSSKTIIVNVLDPTPKVTSLSISPNPLTLAPGEKKQLVITGTMSDGSTKDITLGSEGTTYLNGGSSIVSISADGLITVSSNAADGAKAYITAINNGYSETILLKIVDPTPKVVSYTVTPSTTTLAPGGTIQLTVIATLSDGSTKDITLGSTGTTYSSNNSGVATISANGLITVPANAGDGRSTQVYIYNNNLSKFITINVVDPSVKLTDFTLTPNNSTVLVGNTKQLSVLGTFSDGTKKDITLGSEGTTYSSSNPNFATISADGLVTISSTATNGAKVYITAMNKGISKTIMIMITTNPNKVLSITSNPTSLSLKAGATAQLTIIGNLVDGSQKDITASTNGTTYSSGSTIIANVSANGLVTIPANMRVGFTTNITVINDGITILIPVTIIA
ncbi:Ig-like domain-containing protein [Gottfriedia solisilvae]|uniref:Ig-like domain-containing protein n=1 Tax=Gottfriedia solisilvae TaxID=1516104 RepID=UPI003D2EF8C8